MLRKIILPILALSLVGCSSSQQTVVPTSEPEKNVWLAQYEIDDINFDFSSSYKNDSAQLLVNGKQIFYDTITTHPPTGFADYVTIKKPSDKIDVDVIISEKYLSESFNLKNGRFFIITFYNDQIKIIQEQEPWIYD